MTQRRDAASGPRPRRGRFITFEGGEGTGKSTQIARLRQWLRGRGIEVVATREPGGTPAAERIRSLLTDADADWQPISEALLHFAARCEHVERVIRPALAAGRWVVCDRFTDSTRAYQGAAQGLGSDRVEALNDVAIAGFAPHLTLLLDAPYEVARRRREARGLPADRYERQRREFHEAVRTAFLATARREPDRIRVIDAGDDEDSVAAAVIEVVRRRFRIPAARP